MSRLHALTCRARWFQILKAVMAMLATLGGLDLTGILPIFPPRVAAFLVTIPSAAAVIHHLLQSFLTALDTPEK